MTIDELLMEYQRTTAMEPSILRPFLRALEEAGGTLEGALIRWAVDLQSAVVTLVTPLGLGILNVRYVRPPNRPVEWEVDGSLYDWGSVNGLHLGYRQRYGEDHPAWVLTLAHPEMELSDGDAEKTRAFAAAILRHITPVVGWQ